MADLLPVNFPIPTNNLTFNVDLFDYLTNVGYKKFYLLGTESAGAVKAFALVTDSSLKSDDGAVATQGNAQDVDFDITFNNPATIAAANANVCYTVNGITGKTITVTWTVYHVTSGGTETSIGTIVDYPTAASTGQSRTRSVMIALTKKSFAIGEKLRLNATTSSDSASLFFYHDPSGHFTIAGTGGETNTSTAIFTVPFEVQE